MLIYCCLDTFQLMILNKIKKKQLAILSEILFLLFFPPFVQQKVSINISKVKNVIKFSYRVKFSDINLTFLIKCLPEESRFKWEELYLCWHSCCCMLCHAITVKRRNE